VHNHMHTDMSSSYRWTVLADDRRTIKSADFIGNRQILSDDKKSADLCMTHDR